MGLLDNLSGIVPAHIASPRLSTPGPVDVPRWTDDDADRDVALNTLAGMLAGSPAQSAAPKPVVGAGLGLPSLGLGFDRSAPVVAAARPQPQVDPTVNQGGGAVKSGGGITAYGYKGVTGLAQHRGTGQYGLQPEMADALARANAAMKAAGLGTFSITDGFRSYDAQVDVKRRKPGLAASPGRSIHGLGYAVDIGASRAQKEWLNKNGARFGLYAPIFGKEDWHFQLLPSLAQKRWG